MRGVLNRWIEKSDDQGRFPEDRAVFEYYDQRMKDNYDERIRAIREDWGLQ